MPTGNSMDGAGFRDRLFLAWTLWQGQKGQRLTQKGLGEMVGKLRGQPVPQTTVSDWFNAVVPGLHDVEYIAKALEVDPGWLAFGHASQAPPPGNYMKDLTLQVRPPPKQP